MNLSQIENKLKTMEGFKTVFSGLFGGGKAKKSFDIYSGATKKGVFEVSVLRTETFDDSYYAVMAFSPEKPIDQETKEELAKLVNEISLGTIRYECISYSSLELWRGGKNSHANENKSITEVATKWPHIFVFPVVVKKNDLDCKAIIYATKDNQHYIYPLPKAVFNKLIQ